MKTHEDLIGSVPVRGGSDRGFAVVFTIVFAGFGLWPLLGGSAPRAGALAAAALILAIGLARPRWLAPCNRAWLRLGLLLHRIVSPVVMGALYYAVITPTGLIMRALGKDPLRLRYDQDATSYWVRRPPPGGPSPESMKYQF